MFGSRLSEKAKISIIIAIIFTLLIVISIFLSNHFYSRYDYESLERFLSHYDGLVELKEFFTYHDINIEDIYTNDEIEKRLNDTDSMYTLFEYINEEYGWGNDWLYTKITENPYWYNNIKEIVIDEGWIYNWIQDTAVDKEAAYNLIMSLAINEDESVWNEGWEDALMQIAIDEDFVVRWYQQIYQNDYDLL